MEKIYFINRNVNNTPKNKLDAKLHETFAQLQHRTITEDNLFILDVMFEDAVSQYKSTGGRCQPEKYSRYKTGASNAENPSIYVDITESLSYILYSIVGEATVYTVKQ